jgi:restriction system protein
MGRKYRGAFNELIRYPWWVSVGLAVMVYILSVFVIPYIPIPNPMVKGFITGIALMGPIISFLLLMVAGVSAFYSFRKGKQLEGQTSIDSIGNLSWRRFESLVSEAFRRKGYMALDNIEDGPDGGVDIVLRKDEQVVFVQCKHWKTKKVGVNIVRELLGAMTARNVNEGIVVTSGGFTQEAMDFAKSNSIQLIDENESTALIASVQKSGVQDPIRGIKKPALNAERKWFCELQRRVNMPVKAFGVVPVFQIAGI